MRTLLWKDDGDFRLVEYEDGADRYASIDPKRDPLVEIDAIVRWEDFCPTLERVWRTSEAERKSRAGRKPMDAVVMFKTHVSGALYTRSDDQIEYQVRDWMSCMRFLGLGLEDRVPDAKLFWPYREVLAQAGGRVFSIEEKPEHPRSKYAVTDLYFLDGTAPDRVRRSRLQPVVSWKS